MSGPFKSPAPAAFHGVVQILRFNWPWYALGLFIVGTTSLLLFRVHPIGTAAAAALFGAGALTSFWILASLLVSHIVYDRSGIADGTWICEAMLPAPLAIVNLHAGLDETSAHVARIFPRARLTVFDFHDSSAMTEASIERARRSLQNEPVSTLIPFGRIPLDDGNADLAFVVFAAHELRLQDQRRVFFLELHRTLRLGGDLVVVEHLRDAWNVLAFGPGAFHFLPRHQWLRAFSEAGFVEMRTLRVTPFVTVFLLRGAGGGRTAT